MLLWVLLMRWASTISTGLGDESLQKYITRTRDDVDVLYRSRQVFNAVTDFGINNSGLVDCSAQIQTAFNFLSKLPFGGSIYFPDGVYRLHTEVVPRDNVTITMAPDVRDSCRLAVMVLLQNEVLVPGI